MLSFATEFPLADDSTAESFLDTVKSWVLGSHHTKFREENLRLLTVGCDKSLTAENTKIEIVGAGDETDVALAVRYTLSDEDVDWVTEIAYAGKREPWVSIRTFRDSVTPISHLPPAKKPVLVMTLLDALGGGRDGELVVQKTPHTLGNDDVGLAGRLISGDAGCYLPIVYLSATFDGSNYVNAEALARDLCGMAHIVVEPNRAFSQRLQLEVASENAYGGAIGVYWPDGAGRHLILPNRASSFTERRQAVARTVRQALLNRRPSQWCSWVAAQQLTSRLAIKALKESGSGEVELYVASFDAELALKNSEIEASEAEIRRLQSELKVARQRTAGGSSSLKITSEQDYYAAEISSIIRDAAADAINRVQPNGRREHVLRAFVASNPTSPVARDGREKLKTLLRDYRSMSKEIRDGLADLGFTITDEGKHYKAVYKSDDRYLFSIPKTSSDHRAGLNLASDIAKHIF